MTAVLLQIGNRIEQSVNRMMTVIDHARNSCDRYKKPLKTPLKKMIFVHPDTEFLDDITGKLKEICSHRFIICLVIF